MMIDEVVRTLEQLFQILKKGDKTRKGATYYAQCFPKWSQKLSPFNWLQYQPEYEMLEEM